MDGLYEKNLGKCVNEAKELFERMHGDAPTIAVAAPGRVNLMGGSTDYNDGFVLPMAMPIMTVIVGRRSDSAECNIFSTAIPSEEACQVFSVPPHPGKGSDLVTIGGPLWIKYVKGVIALLNNAGDVPPFEAVITSCVPLGGGVSSSASLEVAVGLFVENLLGRKLPREELALICQEAEHRYAGNKCGIMDQFVSVMAKAGYAVMIDCEQPLKPNCAQLVPMADPQLAVLVIDSGVRHELAGGEYNKRRQSCEAVVRKLKIKSLRYASMEMLEQAQDELSDVEFRRARHVINEISRTEEAVNVLRKDPPDYNAFGQFVNSSHESLRKDYEVSCGPLDIIVDLASQVEGVYGSRLTGGGFGGCIVTFLHKNSVESVKKIIMDEYSEATGSKYQAKFYEASASPGALDITDLLALC